MARPSGVSDLDDQAFDRLARSIATGVSRCSAPSGLLAAVGGVFVRSRSADAATPALTLSKSSGIVGTQRDRDGDWLPGQGHTHLFLDGKRLGTVQSRQGGGSFAFTVPKGQLETHHSMCVRKYITRKVVHHQAQRRRCSDGRRAGTRRDGNVSGVRRRRQHDLRALVHRHAMENGGDGGFIDHWRRYRKVQRPVRRHRR